MTSPAVLILAPLPPQRCGVSRHAHSLGRFLAGRGFRPVALTYWECGRGDYFRKTGFEARHLPTLVRPDSIPFVRAVLYVLMGIGPGIALVSREKICLIHAHGAIPQALLACILSRLLNVPYIYTSHGAELTLHNARGKIFKKLIRSIIVRAAAVTSVCRGNLDYMSRDNAKGFYVPNGIDDAFLEKYAGSNRRLDTGASPAQIIFVGHVNAVKGVDLLIRAAETWAKTGDFDFHLKIVGDGPARSTARYVRDCEAAGLTGRVVFTGIREDVPRLLAEADIFVQPSRMEGLPTALLEAMTVGVPVVAAAAGGIPDIVIHEKNGLLVPPGDASALAASVRRLAADPDLRRRLRQGGLETVSAFRWSEIGAAYLDVYRTIGIASP
ncbi:MAG: glycosyltransferase [Acidobacteriota bacterium]|nr:glycosyltransferase [Acidobacteriota bacterium]